MSEFWSNSLATFSTGSPGSTFVACVITPKSCECKQIQEAMNIQPNYQDDGVLNEPNKSMNFIVHQM